MKIPPEDIGDEYGFGTPGRSMSCFRSVALEVVGGFSFEPTRLRNIECCVNVAARDSPYS